MNLITRFFSALFLTFFVSNQAISENISEIFSNLIPGEGDTEVSIDIRDNHKPDYSILAVREIEKTETGNYFTQFSLFNTEKNNDERLVGNIGIGKRNLSDDNKIPYIGIKNDEYDTIVPMCKNYFDAIPQNELPEKLRKKETKKKKENKK